MLDKPRVGMRALSDYTCQECLDAKAVILPMAAVPFPMHCFSDVLCDC